MRLLDLQEAHLAGTLPLCLLLTLGAQLRVASLSPSPFTPAPVAAAKILTSEELAGIKTKVTWRIDPLESYSTISSAEVWNGSTPVPSHKGKNHRYHPLNALLLLNA